jgi:hypothetical protein
MNFGEFQRSLVLTQRSMNWPNAATSASVP